MGKASRDENRVTTLLAVSNADNITPIQLWADPVTHRLLVDLPGGTGDVVGPASAVDSNFASFDGTTGKLIKDSGYNSSSFLTSLSGAVLTDQTTPQTIGNTTNRLAYLYATDVDVTNDLVANIKANSSSGGVQVKNANGVTVASFGVGSASSTAISLAGSVALGANNISMTGSLGSTGAGKLTKGWFTDVEITNLPTINGGTLISALPSASTSVNGILTSTDWNTFNGKQDALVSGTNIKTINSTSLLGSGDIAIAPMVYPGAGVPVSTGSAWGTSKTTPSGDIVGTTDPQTVRDKRNQPRVSSTTSTSTLTPDLSSYSVYYLTAQAAALTIANPTGTPVIGEVIAIYVTDNGTAQTLTFGTEFKAYGAALPTTTTASKTLMITAQFDGTNFATLTAELQ